MNYCTRIANLTWLVCACARTRLCMVCWNCPNSQKS